MCPFSCSLCVCVTTLIELINKANPKYLAKPWIQGFMSAPPHNPLSLADALLFFAHSWLVDYAFLGPFAAGEKKQNICIERSKRAMENIRRYFKTLFSHGGKAENWTFSMSGGPGEFDMYANQTV